MKKYLLLILFLCGLVIVSIGGMHSTSIRFDCIYYTISYQLEIADLGKRLHRIKLPREWLERIRNDVT